MRPVPSVGCAIVAAVLLAGCFATPSMHSTFAGPSSPAAGSLPAACDASRLAVAYGDNGTRPPAALAVLPVPCLFHTGFSGAYEPTLGVDKTGSIFFFPVRQGNPQVIRSDDSGEHWKAVGPTLGQTPSHATTVDPYFYLDPETGRIFADDDVTANCAQFSFSDDKGATWTNAATGCVTLDHQTIFAGKPVSSMTLGYPRVVYRCAYQASGDGAGLTSACLKSVTGGLTWIQTGAPAFEPEAGTGNAGVPACDPALGHGAAGPDGTIYLPNGFCGVPMLAISHDEGATWTTVRVSDLGEAVTPYGMYGHEAGVGADAKGNVYYGWVARDRHPYVVVSRDGGRTWGPPLAVAPPGLHEASLPEMIVGGEGKLALAFMGSNDAPPLPKTGPDCSGASAPSCMRAAACPMYGACVLGRTITPGYENTTWSTYIVETANALDAHPTFLGAALSPPTDPVARGPCDPNGCTAENDFIDIRIGPDGGPWVSLVDGCEKTCVSGKTRTSDASEATVGHLAGGPNLLDP